MSGPAAAGRPALFVDRDGTLIADREYLGDPDGVSLLPGAVEGLRRFGAAGYEVVIVTNQSGIARGYYDEAAYRRVTAEVLRQLGAAGVKVLDTYHCPHHPDFTGPCDCRKPAPGLFQRAAREHGLDLGRSIYVGDRLRDVEPGLRLGGRGYLVRTGHGPSEAPARPSSVPVVDDLAAVATTAIGAG